MYDWVLCDLMVLKMYVKNFWNVCLSKNVMWLVSHGLLKVSISLKKILKMLFS